MSGKLPLRNELDPQYTWDLSLLFKDQAAYEAGVQVLKAAVSDFKQKYKGQLQNPQVILSALAAYNQIRIKLSWAMHYASMAYEVDKLDQTAEENIGKFNILYEKIAKDLSFFSSELAQLSDADLDAVAEIEGGADYQPVLAQIKREKAHMLAPDLEEALSGLANSIQSNYELYNTMKFQDMFFADFEAKGQTYHNAFSAFEQDYEPHPDKDVRRAAWKSFHEGLAHYQHTAARNYIQQVETEKKLASLRGFDSVFDYLLYDQEVSRQDYDQIIDTYTQDFAPVMRRYAKLLKAQHDLEDISLADIKIPFAKGPVATIDYAESRKIIEAALAPLGQDYLDIVGRAFDQRWIDYPMNQTKSTGGFCSTVYGGPSYILLNWTASLSEVLVLAHELGHAGHFTLLNQNNLAITPEPSMYFVEAPSTANEVITCSYLLNQPIDESAKRDLVGEFIARTYFHNMVTHLLEADFQRKVYTAVDAGQVLNAGKLNQFYRESLENFWGDALEVNPGAELTWMRQPHYFMGLYSYTYSAGLTIGTQIGQKIAAGDQTAVTAWLEVLKAGGTLGPIELAAKAGVDMKDKATLQATIKFVDGLLDQLEA